MTERERRWLDYERSHASIRRILLLTLVILTGALLGYRGSWTPGPGVHATYGSTGGVP